MTIDPLVSIIVPVYRMEQYLPRCMASLLAQTYHNLEIILVDDGSPDDSGALCDAYAQRDPRVRAVHQGNGGPSAARNAGIDVARGSLLTFVDPDDWVHVELVAHLVSLLANTDADLAVCRFVRTDGGDVAVAGRGGAARVLDTDGALGLYAGPSTSWMTSPCAKLFRVGLFDRVRFPVGRLYEDEFTTFRLVAAATRIVLSEAELYYYFTRPGSATQGQQQIGQVLDRIDALREQADFFRQRGLSGVSSNALWRAFLLQRQVRGRMIATGDKAALRRLARETRAVARDLRTSQEPRHKKVMASFYVMMPWLVDGAIRAYRILTRRDTARK